VAADSTNAVLMQLAAAITKSTATWAVGTAAGALDSGSIANNTWYHVHQIRRPDTGVVDVLVSLSPTAPTLPTNYTQSRRIGAMRTNASAQWIAFRQFGDEFLWTTAVADATSGAVSTARTLFTLTAPPNTKAMFRALAWGTGATAGFIIQATADTDAAPAGPNVSLYAEVSGQGGSGHFAMWLDGSSQLAVRSSLAAGNVSIGTYGWVDRRGRDA
jgi:hypothetical protein